MANKKITVVGDGAEEPLTPEEEHRIEVKVDLMLDPNIPDEVSTPESKAAQKAESALAPVAEQPTPTSKVTKIVTTFADDEPVIEAKIPEPAPEVKPAAPHKAKPASKKIAVHHHDEVEAVETPKKPAAKHPKAKAKKLKVTVADDSEPDDLNAEADAITASALAAEEQLSAPDIVPESTQPEVIEASEDTVQGAPPLIQKHAVAPIGVTAELKAEVPDSPKPAANSKKIAAPHDELEDEPAEPKAEEALEVDTPAETTEDKKYRPPDGPLQFKRAEDPIQPHKPGELRVDAKPADELTEDEAIAQAFEAKSSGTGDRARQLVGGLVRVVKWTLVLVVVAGVIAIGALPTLRHKALNLIGVDTDTQSSKKVTTVNNAAAPTATGQDVYIAKRAGAHNVYRANLNGQQEQLVLAATGKETSNLTLAPNASSTVAALVSTRDGKQDSSGATQQSLTLVTVSNGATTVSDTAAQVKLIGWFGDTIVYTLSNTSTSTTDSNRYQLISYNVTSKVRIVLDHATYLNDVIEAKGSVYYATAASQSGAGKLLTIQPDGSGKKTILNTEVAAITRTGYDSLLLSSVSKWYSYKLGSLQATATSNIGQGDSRQYTDSPDSKHSVYLNTDGDSPQLKLLDTVSHKETVLVVTGASSPIHWVGNDTVVYRNNGADCSVKIGGQPTKVADVFDAAGISLWHQR